MSTTAPCLIDLWTWPLDPAAAEISRLRPLLSPDELERADRFVMGRDRTHFVAARGRLREILANRLSTTPEGLAFAYSEHGKPRLIGGSAPRFNLSHSGGMAALAISNDAETGIDIEAVRTIKEDLARDNFSASEQRELAALSAHDRREGFFRCWTRKEAVIKATGEGFARDLMSFDVSLSVSDPRLLRIEGDDAAAWRLAHFEPREGYIGAIACRTGGAPINVTRRTV
jgi:4'-phosphopantetheinyl transferase